jgi:hypothetical protein
MEVRMKTLTRLTTLTLLVLVPLMSCDGLFEARDRSYTDEPKLAFAPSGEIVNEGAGEVTFEIQLIGPQRDSNLPVNFSVADSSTAQAGVHYSLGSTSSTIPANSSSTEFTVEALDNSADDGGTNYELFLNLDDSEDVEAATNLKTFTLTVRGQDE